MGKTGHHLTGIAAGCLAACCLWPAQADLALLAIPAGYAGGTAPDWLEIAHAEYSQKYRRYVRRSVIPHRTITHWWPLWLIVLSIGFYLFHQTGRESIMAGIMIIGFSAGAWMHLLMDIPNPSGIPIKTPYAKSRYGLGWWKSGNSLEPIAGILMVVGSAMLLFFITGIGK